MKEHNKNVCLMHLCKQSVRNVYAHCYATVSHTLESFCFDSFSILRSNVFCFLSSFFFQKKNVNNRLLAVEKDENMEW